MYTLSFSSIARSATPFVVGALVLSLLLLTACLLTACDSGSPADDPDPPAEARFPPAVLGSWSPVEIDDVANGCPEDPGYDATQNPASTDVLVFSETSTEATLDVYYVPPLDVADDFEVPHSAIVDENASGLYLFDKQYNYGGSSGSFTTPISLVQDTLRLNFGTYAHPFADIDGAKVDLVRYEACHGNPFDPSTY
jgi:hypothetical protein